MTLHRPGTTSGTTPSGTGPQAGGDHLGATDRHTASDLRLCMVPNYSGTTGDHPLCPWSPVSPSLEGDRGRTGPATEVQPCRY